MIRAIAAPPSVLTAYIYYFEGKVRVLVSYIDFILHITDSYCGVALLHYLTAIEVRVRFSDTSCTLKVTILLTLYSYKLQLDVLVLLELHVALHYRMHCGNCTLE